MVPDFKKKKNPFRRVLAAGGAIMMIIIAVFLFIADAKVFHKRQKFESEILNLQGKIDDMRDKNERLKNDIANIDNSSYIEKIAREELSLQKPGENVVLFIEDGEQKKEQSPKAQKSFLQNWLSWISGIFGK